MEKILTLFTALLIDIFAGEPRAMFHPVVWIGRLIVVLDRLSSKRSGVHGLLSGVRIVVLTLGAVIGASTAARSLHRRMPFWLRVLPYSWLLKTTFSLRGLWQAADAVAGSLAKGQTNAARTGLQALVSRDVKSLDEPRLAAAAVESVAENTSDSFVAPVFYYSLFGLPGALAYRAVNTMDSMLGYHGDYEYLGKAAARLDDFANFIPARLTAALFALAAAMEGHDLRRTLSAIRRDSSKTESPNAGFPMSAMAGALAVELEKVGHYRLGSPGELPDNRTIKNAIRLSKLACLLMTSVAISIEVLRRGRSV